MECQHPENTYLSKVQHPFMQISYRTKHRGNLTLMKHWKNVFSMVWILAIISLAQFVWGQDSGNQSNQTPLENTSKQAIPKESKKKRAPLLGVLLDVGVPDGIGLSLAVRPFSWLRLHGGGTSDLVSGGVRGGVSFIVPVHFFIQPSATIEAGYQFKESSNWLATRFSNNPYFSNPWFQQINYSYVNGHLGLEIGSPRFTFYVHGGLSYIHTVVNDFHQQLIAQSTTSPSLVLTNPNVNGVIPSAKLGFVVYFW